jgi:putative ABC transport system permease protein
VSIRVHGDLDRAVPHLLLNVHDLGSEPRGILNAVIREGAVMSASGVIAGAVFGFVLAHLGSKFFLELKMSGALPVVVSSAWMLMTVAVIASVLPAARAARVDVMQALRSE